MKRISKLDRIVCNQIAIMEALVVIMAHSDKPELGRMTKTWQFDFLKRAIAESQDSK